jgi:hypothetical protein
MSAEIPELKQQANKESVGTRQIFYNRDRCFDSEKNMNTVHPETRFFQRRLW